MMRRELGIPGAVLLGLGSMVGTGAFVGLGLASGYAGPWLPAVVLLAGLLAMCNGISSAQLAAAYPKSGGTYEYGYRVLNPSAGFVAGVMFLLAKSASAAAASLGVVAAVSALTSVDLPRSFAAPGVVVLITAVVLLGLRRSSRVNAVLVGITVLGLGLFVTASLLSKVETAAEGFRYVSGSYAAFFSPEVLRFEPVEHDALEQMAEQRMDALLNSEPWSGGATGLLAAIALSFVAFTGYGRVATLGEEIKDPKRNIPRSVVATVTATTLIYALVALAGQHLMGWRGFAWLAQEGDPLAAGLGFSQPTLAQLVRVSAVAAMLGVILNLILGLSRVALAMGRRRDLPRAFGRLHGPEEQGQPRNAILLCGAIVLGLSLLGDLELAWGFSAFTVLIYYGLTNLAALRLPQVHRTQPRLFSWVGLVGCVGLAGFVPWRITVVGLVCLAIAALGHWLAPRRRSESNG